MGEEKEAEGGWEIFSRLPGYTEKKQNLAEQSKQ
jgi:hypothetical protein